WHINYIKKQGEVYAVSTAALDKGGIDHSTSAFRVMHVDGKGDFVSELRYTYLDKLIKIASLGNGYASLYPSGSIPLSVNAYSTVSPVKEVSYTYSIDGKGESTPKHLKKQTDWSWYGQLSLSELKDSHD